MSTNKFFNYKNIIPNVEGLNKVNACIRCSSYLPETVVCTQTTQPTQSYNCCDKFSPIVPRCKMIQFPVKEISDDA